MTAGLCVALAAASAGQAAAATHPHATGGVTFSGGTERASFEAHDFGAPALDRGTIHYRNLAVPEINYTAEIICASVVGRTARFGYVIPDRPGLPRFVVGLPVVATVIDGANGEPDMIGYSVAPATSCDTTFTPFNPVVAGELVVHTP